MQSDDEPAVPVERVENDPKGLRHLGCDRYLARQRHDFEPPAQGIIVTAGLYPGLQPAFATHRINMRFGTGYGRRLELDAGDGTRAPADGLVKGSECERHRGKGDEDLEQDKALLVTGRRATFEAP